MAMRSNQESVVGLSSHSAQKLTKNIVRFAKDTIGKFDLIFVDRVPLLQHDFVVLGARLSRNQLLQIANGVIRITLHANFLAQTVIACDFNHFVRLIIQLGIILELLFTCNRFGNVLTNSIEHEVIACWKMSKQLRCVQVRLRR